MTKTPTPRRDQMRRLFTRLRREGGTHPVLGIPGDCLSSPSHVHLLIIERTMLYPTKHVLERLSPVQARAWGFLSGVKLRKMVGYAKLGLKGGSSAEVNRTIASILWRFRRVSAKTIDNEIWPQYRTVSPLWAAWYHRSLTEGPDVFPCRAVDLAAFLATSEAFRQAAETLKSAETSRTILRPNEAIRPAANLQLPTITLEFELREGGRSSR